jgi:hypothetical protein
MQQWPSNEGQNSTRWKTIKTIMYSSVLGNLVPGVLVLGLYVPT